MRVRIRTRHYELSRDARAELERRLRLLLGLDAAAIAALDVLLERAAPDEIHVHVRTRLREGDALEVDDRAPQLDEAVAAAVWRLQHRLHRARRLASPGRAGRESASNPWRPP